MATRTAARRSVGAPGFKALVTAVTMAATIGGWAVIAAGSEHSNQQSGGSAPLPVPTLVPTPAPYAAPANSAVAANPNSSARANNAVPTAPAVRSVTINPNLFLRPQAITRSSR